MLNLDLVRLAGSTVDYWESLGIDDQGIIRLSELIKQHLEVKGKYEPEAIEQHAVDTCTN